MSVLFAIGTCVAGCGTTQPKASIVYFPASPAKARVVHLISFGSLRDVAPQGPSLRDVLMGAPIGPFVRTPAGLAWADGHLYVCNTGLNVVHDWDLVAGTARRLGGSGDVILRKPVAVAVAGDGSVFVADTERGEIVIFDKDGHGVGTLKPPERTPYRPTALAVQGDRLWAADISAHRIDAYVIADRRHETSIGGAGSGPGQMYYPMGLAIGPAGRLFVSDTFNARVQVFGRDGRFERSFGEPGDRYGDMGKPRQLAVAPDGVVFITDVEFAHVHAFDSRGRLLLLFDGPDDRPGGTPMPVGVTVAERVPAVLESLVPEDFTSSYYLFVSNAAASRPLSLFAVGRSTPDMP